MASTRETPSGQMLFFLTKEFMVYKLLPKHDSNNFIQVSTSEKTLSVMANFNKNNASKTIIKSTDGFPPPNFDEMVESTNPVVYKINIGNSNNENTNKVISEELIKIMTRVQTKFVIQLELIKSFSKLQQQNLRNKFTKDMDKSKFANALYDHYIVALNKCSEASGDLKDYASKVKENITDSMIAAQYKKIELSQNQKKLDSASINE